jgi:transposase
MPATKPLADGAGHTFSARCRAVRFDMRRVNHLRLSRSSVPGKLPEQIFPNAAPKNDDRDAEAIAEAATRPTMRFVALKSQEQLDMQTLHRARDRAVGERTSLTNQLRAVLLERGVIVPQGRTRLRVRVTPDVPKDRPIQRLPEILAKPIDVLSPHMIAIIEDLSGDWWRLDERVERVTEEIEQLAHGSESCRQLMTVPGIGPLIVSAMVAAIANGAAFAKGRDFAAWLGLVPKQNASSMRRS